MEGMGKAWGVRRRGRLRPRAGQAVSKDGTSGLEKQGDHRTRLPPPRKTTCAGRWGLCTQEGGIDLVPAEQRQARDATCCTPAGCPGVVCSRPPLTCWVIPEPPPPNHTTGSGPEAGGGGGTGRGCRASPLRQAGRAAWRWCCRSPGRTHPGTSCSRPAPRSRGQAPPRKRKLALASQPHRPGGNRAHAGALSKG